MVNKRLINTGEAIVPFDPLQNFETVTYTGNGSTQKITGYIRKGAAFNGSSSVITIPNIKSQLQSGASFTISCWVNVSSSQSGEAMIINTAASSGTQGVNIGIRASTGLVYFQIRGNNNLNADGTTNLVGAGWKNIVLTHTTSSTILYVNGTQEASIGANTIGTIPNDLTFGKWANSSLYYLNGSIDQVRIFNTALNSTQVGQLALEDYTDPKKSTTDYFGDGSGVALYELDEDANSSNFEQAAVFNGSSRITSDDPVKNDTTFSISAWINVDNINTFNPIISVYGSSAGTKKYLFRVSDSNSLDFFTYDESGVITGIVQESSALTVGTWHHVAATVESGGDLELYLDGVSVATDTGNSNVNTDATADLIIGSRDDYAAGSSVNNFNGKIDQVRIYSSALDSTDVEKLYKESADVPTSNLVAHYKLDGNATDETETYDGTASNVTYSAGVYGGTPTNVNFLGMAFQPDLVWLKSRDSIYSGNHQWYDSVRGAGKVIYSDGAYVEATNPIDGYLGSFDSNGFSLSSGTRNTNDVSNSGENYVAWCWKAADTTTTISAGTIGNTIASDVRANTDAGFSIVKYTGGNSASDTVGHGLTDAEVIILKDLTDGTNNWRVWHKDLTANYWMYLNLTLGQANAATDGGIRNVDANTFGFINGTTEGVEGVNSNASDYIAYCFHSVDGYQKVGSYTGNNPNTVTVDLGFVPRFIMTKAYANYPSPAYWHIVDTTRDSSLDAILYANASDTEASISSNTTFMQPLSIANGDSVDGFSTTGANSSFNYSGASYLYLAIA